MTAVGYLKRKLSLKRFTPRNFIVALALVYLIFSFSIPNELVIVDVTSSARHDFYHFLYDALLRYKPLRVPSFDSLRDTSKCRDGDIPFNPSDIYSKGSYENLDSCLHLTDRQLSDLGTKHSKFVDKILQFVATQDELLQTLFPNEKGIVTVGGGKYSVISLTMIEMLREKGSTLPVEVIIPPRDEYEDDFCNRYLPHLNAKCVYLSEVIPKGLLGKIPLGGYQFKVFALLVSSFQKALFLDADDMPLANPDVLFEEPIFHEKGSIVWPDIWRRVTSPSFYKVTNVDINLEKRVRYMADDISPVSRYQKPDIKPSEFLSVIPLHDLEGTIPDPTSESGQLLIDKLRHLSTLLLASYYNVHSEWYYKMLSQGTSGEGDKETFIAAAHVLQNPYYQVKSKVTIDGFFDDDGGYHGISLYQYDPQQDYDQYKRAKDWVQDHLEDFSEYEPSYNVHRDFYDHLLSPPDKPIDVVFSHAGYHKFEPLELSKERTYIDRKGAHFRGFKRLDITKGFDIELFNFELLHRKLCTDDRIIFKYYEQKMQSDEWVAMCQYLKDRESFLQETHHLAVLGQNIP